MRLIDPDIPESELVGSNNPVGGKSGGSTPKRYRPPLHRTLSDESLSGGGATFARSSNNASNNPGGFSSPRQSTINILANSSSSDAVFTAKPAQIVSPRNLKDHHHGHELTTSSTDQLYPPGSPRSNFPSKASSASPAKSATQLSSSLGAAGPPGRQSSSWVPPPSSSASTQPAVNSTTFPLPEAAAGNIEWNNLVDAANRVIRDSDLDVPPTSLTPLSTSLERINCAAGAAAAAAVAGAPSKPARDPAAVNGPQLSNAAAAVAAAAAAEPESFQATELAKQLQELQQQLQRERLGRATLEEEVNYLRSDNERLAEESQTAAAQLRKFTEWFFTTIDKS